nr:MAG TPA: hypothetical protein [Caudoviricetes sp.]
METASIVIEIATVCNGNITKNKVTLQIPREAAIMISKAWQSEELPQRNAIVAHNLLCNQIAHCDLVIDNGVAGGMLNMVKEDTDFQRCFRIVEYDY